jgi:hypothetical protein
MKRLLFLLLIFLVQEMPSGAAMPADPFMFAYDTLAIKPLRVNTEERERFKEDDQYDYFSRQAEEEASFLERLLNTILRWLTKPFSIDPGAGSGSRNLIFILAGLILLSVLGILAYRMFFRNTGRLPESCIADETIYGIDFDRQIAEAVHNRRYTNAICLRYLQTLKLLQDTELIDWHPHKTVTEYLYDLKDSKLREVYRELSIHFLYFRYGNFEANETHYRTVDDLSGQIKKMTEP